MRLSQADDGLLIGPFGRTDHHLNPQHVQQLDEGRGIAVARSAAHQARVAVEAHPFEQAMLLKQAHKRLDGHSRVIAHQLPFQTD
jgi:hypothetical protein